MQLIGADNIKSGDIALGALLLVIGFAVFWYGYSVLQQYNTSVGQLAMALSADAQAQYNQGEIEAIGGGILALIGVIVGIYGAAASSQSPNYGYTAPSSSPNQQPPRIQASLSRPTPPPPYAVHQKIFIICNERNLGIGPGQGIFHKFSVPKGTTEAILRGTFQAFGGEGNDIMAFVMSETDYLNWRNNHDAQAYYQSGQVTAGQINIVLSPIGTYFLVFSNSFSDVSSKTLSAQVNLVCTMPP
jgi:hypothetical protein